MKTSHIFLRDVKISKLSLDIKVFAIFIFEEWGIHPECNCRFAYNMYKVKADIISHMNYSNFAIFPILPVLFVCE